MIRILGGEIKVTSGMVVTLIMTLLLQTASAQTSNSDQSENHTLRPSIGMLLIISSATIFLFVTFVVYIRHCSTSNPTTTSTTTSIHTISISSSHSCHRGLDPSILSTFPSFAYSEVKSHKIGKGTLECAVCLEEFEDEEVIKLLPKCDHVFHLDCIDAWLRSHFTCPVCRANLDPDPDPERSSSAAGPSRTGSEAVSLLRWRSDETVRSETIAGPEEIDRRRSANRRTPSLSLIGSFFFSRFGRWNSTGHCVVQPGDDLNRFTLKLPREIRNQLLNRSASALVLPTVSSMRNGYRIPGRGRRYGSAEADDRWWRLGIGSSFFSRNWYKHSPEGIGSVKSVLPEV